MDVLDFNSYYLVGIKGVAMTALAQCLADAGEIVKGCDVSENFVTGHLLRSLNIQIDTDFQNTLPDGTDCVIHTAAHQGAQNSVVQTALESNIPVFTYAQALAALFNAKKGIGVSGVGGKSTVSAMVAWILHTLAQNGAASPPSFLIGVGDISNLGRTGAWNPEGGYFVAEADDYVTDPTVAERGQPLEPKFWQLKPFVAVCTNLKFDHPDVYTDFKHTKSAFLQFFQQTHPEGFLVFNGQDNALTELRSQIGNKKMYTYGELPENDLYYTEYHSQEGWSSARVHAGTQSCPLRLPMPARFNIMNALAALTVVIKLGFPLSESCAALATFHSTKRRFEFIGEKNGVKYYDDYAHHPHEVSSTIQALQEWYPSARIAVAFQPHTFSRTKELFSEFVQAFANAQEVLLTDIFPSAREASDPSVSCDILAQAIKSAYPQINALNLKTNGALAEYFKTHLSPGDVAITMGAGDIYLAHDLV